MTKTALYMANPEQSHGKIASKTSGTGSSALSTPL